MRNGHLGLTLPSTVLTMHLLHYGELLCLQKHCVFSQFQRYEENVELQIIFFLRIYLVGQAQYASY
jgi:hypothetical protein